MTRRGRRKNPKTNDKLSKIMEKDEATELKSEEDKAIELKPQEGESTELKSEEGKATKVKSKEGKATESKSEKGDATELKPKEGEATELKSEEGKATELKSEEGEATELKPKEGKATELQSKKGKVAELKSKEGEATELKSKEGEETELKSKEGEATTTVKANETVISKHNNNTTNGINSINNDESKKKSLEAKKNSSLGSILLGLANRHQEINSQTNPDEVKSQKEVSDPYSEAGTSNNHKQDTSSEKKITSFLSNCKSNVNKDFRRNYGEDVDDWRSNREHYQSKRSRNEYDEREERGYEYDQETYKEKAVVREENNEIYVRDHKPPQRKPTFKDIENEKKAQANNMAFEEGWGSKREHYQSKWSSREHYQSNRSSREHHQSKRSRREYDEDKEHGYGYDQETYQEKSVVREENDVIYVRGHKPKPKPTLEFEKKAQANNMTFEEEAEMRKSRSVGSMLASLANRTFPDPPPPSNNFARRDHHRGSSYDRDSHGFGSGSRKGTYYEEDYAYDQRRGRRDTRQRSEERQENKLWKKKKDEFDPVKAAEERNAEAERLDKELGKGIVTVAFTENRVMAYICEICQLWLFNKKSLDDHVDGMQHLRKKNLYDKRKRKTESETSQNKGGPSGWVGVNKDEELTSTRGGDSESSYSQGDDNYSGQPPPPAGEGYMTTGGHDHGGKSNKNWVASQINTAAPPPPPLPVSEKPLKPKNFLLQKLDACAVKNAKDEKLALSVIESLIKSLKEYNHKQGDTKLIEILSEIDVKCRGLKRSLSINTSQKNRDTAKFQTSTQQSTSSVPCSNAKVLLSSESTQNSPSLNTISPTNSSGIWYTQGRNTLAVAQSGVAQETQENMKSSKNASSSLMGSGYASNYGTDGTSSYPAHMKYYNVGYSSSVNSDSKQANSKYKTSQGKPGTNDTGYHAQGSTSAYTYYQEYSSNVGNSSVMEITQSSNKPPPPPPPEKGAISYSSQIYRPQMPPVCFQMTAPPPPYKP